MHRTAPLRALTLLASLMLLLGATAAPAIAHHSPDHENGGGNSENPGSGGGKSGSGGGKSGTSGGGGKPADDPRSKHPSGKNKEKNPGPADDEQGKSPSDPDGVENGGADKPGGSGGEYEWDQDGNNGCGNDTDFEDDNRGNCGGPEKDRDGCPKDLPEQASRGRGKKLGHTKRGCEEEQAALTPTLLLGTGTGTTDAGGTIIDVEVPDDGTLVPSGRMGSEIVSGPTAELDAEVLGMQIERASSSPDGADSVMGTGQRRNVTVLGVPLPLTGALALLLWLPIALALLGAGAFLLRLRPRPSKPRSI
ncbi:MAG TPA: hypothetical protein VM784_02550 [Actinomycetota bacterium]|nr:hypothetical protein [Actinomycetota bacterium]